MWVLRITEESDPTQNPTVDREGKALSRALAAETDNGKKAEFANARCSLSERRRRGTRERKNGREREREREQWKRAERESERDKRRGKKRETSSRRYRCALPLPLSMRSAASRGRRRRQPPPLLFALQQGPHCSGPQKQSKKKRGGGEKRESQVSRQNLDFGALCPSPVTLPACPFVAARPRLRSASRGACCRPGGS